MYNFWAHFLSINKNHCFVFVIPWILSAKTVVLADPGKARGCFTNSYVTHSLTDSVKETYWLSRTHVTRAHTIVYLFTQRWQLNYTSQCCTALKSTSLHCTVLHCTALHCTALHCKALLYTSQYFTALYFPLLKIDLGLHKRCIKRLSKHNALNQNQKDVYRKYCTL